MTTYRFEDLLTQGPRDPGSNAVQLSAADTVNFSGGSANAVGVLYGVAPNDAATVTVTFGGHAVTFDSSIQTLSNTHSLHFDDGSNLVIGGPAGEVLEAHDGDDAFYGGAGGDTILAHGGDNLIQGNQGNDNILSDEGADTILGGQGDDSIASGTGLVPVPSAAGVGPISPEAGDLVNGNKGADSIAGGGGNDTLLGGQDNDSIQGRGGNDWISGDRGDDTLTGGAGGDVFLAVAHGGDDRVLDFNGAEGDRIRVEAGVAFDIRQDGADTLILVDHGSSTMRLVGIQASTLHSDWVVGV